MSSKLPSTDPEHGQPLLSSKVNDEITEETPLQGKHRDSFASEATGKLEIPDAIQPEQYRTASDASVAAEEPKDTERRVFEINTAFPRSNKQRRFMNNKISTTKYTCLTFLPKNLFEQFTKMANAYFLLLTLMELIPSISDSGGKPVLLLPLSFVVGVSMIKDIFEDRKRYVSDREENVRESAAAPRAGNSFNKVRSQNIQVGSICKVKENEFFPCDMLLLNSSIPKGICYVETKNLDGETNLKHKQADKSVIRLAKSDDEVLRNFNGAVIECEKPNEFLYKF